MSTALAKHDFEFSREQLDTIKNVICPGITDAELGLFKEVCRAKQLSPFSRQIYVTKRNTWDADLKRSVPKMTIQTGIDGFRLIAERSQKYRGQTPFEWCGQDGKWTEVWLSDNPPAAARAGVLRSDFSEPLYRVARWKAYVQTKQGGEPNSMWAKMGPEQLAKCAEALALRTAFPEELSGLYTDDEMEQAGEATPQPKTQPTQPQEPEQPKIEERFFFYWYSGNKHRKTNADRGDDIRTLEPQSLLNYIKRLEGTMKDPSKLNDQGIPWAELAKPYHAAAVGVLDERMLAEENRARAEAKRLQDAAAAGADPATGEVIPDAQFEPGEPGSNDSPD